MKPTFCDLRPLPTSPELASGHRRAARCARRRLNRRPTPSSSALAALLFLYLMMLSLSCLPHPGRTFTHLSKPISQVTPSVDPSLEFHDTLCIQLLGPSSHCVPIPSDAAIYYQQMVGGWGVFLVHACLPPTVPGTPPVLDTVAPYPVSKGPQKSAVLADDARLSLAL